MPLASHVRKSITAFLFSEYDKAPREIVEKEDLKRQRLDEVIKNLEHKKSLILEI